MMDQCEKTPSVSQKEIDKEIKDLKLALNVLAKYNIYESTTMTTLLRKLIRLAGPLK